MAFFQAGPGDADEIRTLVHVCNRGRPGIAHGRAQTANGEVRTASVRINEVILGNMLDRNVPALVNSGEMDTSLLGMSYLQKFSRIEIADNTLVLER